MRIYLTSSTYVRTEVNYTEEVEDPVDSDGKNSLHFCLPFGRGMDLPANTAVKTVTETLQEIVLKGSFVVLEQCLSLLCKLHVTVISEAA